VYHRQALSKPCDAADDGAERLEAAPGVFLACDDETRSAAALAAVEILGYPRTKRWLEKLLP